MKLAFNTSTILIHLSKKLFTVNYISLKIRFDLFSSKYNFFLLFSTNNFTLTPHLLDYMDIQLFIVSFQRELSSNYIIYIINIIYIPIYRQNNTFFKINHTQVGRVSNNFRVG